MGRCVDGYSFFSFLLENSSVSFSFDHFSGSSQPPAFGGQVAPPKRKTLTREMAVQYNTSVHHLRSARRNYDCGIKIQKSAIQKTHILLQSIKCKLKIIERKKILKLIAKKHLTIKKKSLNKYYVN